jgi:hypothetical protein
LHADRRRDVNSFAGCRNIADGGLELLKRWRLLQESRLTQYLKIEPLREITFLSALALTPDKLSMSAR